MMKRLIITICTLLFITSLSAYRGSIELTKNRRRDGGKRSISMAPSVYQDGSTLSFYSDIPIEKLQITVKDKTSQIILSGTIPVLPQQSYAFYIGNLEDGNYTLELDDGKEEYCGYFEIMQ